MDSDNNGNEVVHLVLVKTTHQYSFTQHIFMSSNAVNKAEPKLYTLPDYKHAKKHYFQAKTTRDYTLVILGR